MVVRATDRYVAQNRRARYDYLISDTLEAGIMLAGSEVKTLRLGQASIAESYAGERGGELFLFNAYIPVYKPANRFNHEERRARKLLVHKKQRDKLLGSIKREGITLVPLSIYFNERGIAKLELGVAKGKKKADKRAAEKAKDWQREKGRLMRRED
ncbi:MAG: SsrA-binding protein SmpB [Alphaproteobacteria bacterium]|nr:SsrA-binding protein SmpB [Alphaproteobacteria bacterium]